jgi:hypothetical protein
MKIHQANVDRSGNYRDRSRSKDGYIHKFDDSNPFPALVTAWYPNSQMIDVSVPVDWGQKEIEAVTVYGNFMESVGTIKTPKIATAKGTDTENSWQLYRNPNQSNPSNDEYVLNNHIEALVVKTSIGYAASSFKFVTSDSPLLQNAKYGRTLERFDDGSYRIHDEDGNIQFKHPSGYSKKIGNSVDDIDLEVAFPEHEKNALEYVDGIVIQEIIPSAIGDIIITYDGTGNVKLEHPTGSITDYDELGLLGITSSTGENLKTIIDSFITEVAKIVVAYGTGPDVAALTQLQLDLALLLK